MKKSLLTLMLLICVIMAGAATQGVAVKKVAAKPSKTAPVVIKKSQKAGAQKIMKAPRKAGADAAIDLNFNSDDYSYKWFEGDDASFWYVGVSDDTGEYLMRIAYNTESQTGEVKYEDLNLDYAYLNYFPEEPAEGEESYQEITYQEGTSFSISEDELYVIVTGTIVGGNGKTYAVHAKLEKPQPQTYDIEGAIITQADFYEEDSEWYVRFKDADNSWKITLDLKSADGSFAGTYTMADAYDPDYCFAEDMNEDEDYVFTEMNVTVTMPEGITDPRVGCEITGTAKDAMGNTFNFHMLKNPPIQPKQTYNISVDVVTAEWPSDRTGGSYYELTEKDNPTIQWTLALNTLTGTAEIAPEEYNIDTDLTCRTNTETGETVTVDNGTITQTLQAEDMKIEVVVSLVMTDSIQYNYTFAIPAGQNGEETLTFTDLQVDYSYSDYGSTSLNASNDNTILSAELTDYASIPDTYTDENFNIGLDVYTDGESEYIGKLALVYANTELAEDGTPRLHAKFLAENGKAYTIEASYVKPEIKDELHFTLTDDVILGDYIQYGDGFYFMHDSEDSQIWIRLESDSELVGHYTADKVNANSVVRILQPNGMPKAYYMVDGDFNVTCEGKTYTLTGTCQAGPYRVYLTMTADLEGQELDSYEQDIDVTYTAADVVEVTAYPEDEYSNAYYYVKLLNKERNDELCLVLYPDTFDAEALSSGDYEINTYADGNHAQSGQYDYWDEAIYPSYYAELDAEGNVQTPLWFLTSGTIAVNNENGVLSFEVNAKNSYKRTIHAILPGSDAISTVNAAENSDVVKFVKNNNIIIRKAGKEYNAIGQQIK